MKGLCYTNLLNPHNKYLWDQDKVGKGSTEINLLITTQFIITTLLKYSNTKSRPVKY